MIRQNKYIYIKNVTLLAFQRNKIRTSAGFFTLLFMKRLFMVLGLVTAAFFAVFLDSAPLAPPFPTKKGKKKPKVFLQIWHLSQNCRSLQLFSPRFSTTSSSRSSSKISRPSSTYPVPSERRYVF